MNTFQFLELVNHILYKDCIWRVDDNIFYNFKYMYDLTIKCQGQIYINSSCMVYDVNSFYIFEIGSSYLTQCLPEACI